ncbi:MAG: DUF169 domain-containing protein [Desulfovibrio sp.]|jgi:hypothetical protein|nr:DUF169 domain-containing protein [Desulfovibrio sp.]
MDALRTRTLRLMELLGHDEEPYGVGYTDDRPEGFGPKPGILLDRGKEERGELDWHKVFSTFSCLTGNIKRARSRRVAAYISHEECGCMGGGFYAGVYRPYLHMNVAYVSTGVPGTHVEGEHYMPSLETMGAFMDEIDMPEHKGRYCVVKPLEDFAPEDPALSVTFFARPEAMAGLHSLAGFATGDAHVVVAPFGAACTCIVSWPQVFQSRGEEKAVIGGFDLSARKFLKPDELTFSVAMPLYVRMLDAMEESALTRENWKTVRKRVASSRRRWGGAKD